MRTPKLERGIEGYPGSIAASIRLDARETREIRKALFHARGPLHISEIGKLAGLDATNPAKQSQLSEFISNYLLNSTHETEMIYSTDGRKTFQGWKMTEHGRDLFANLG